MNSKNERTILTKQSLTLLHNIIMRSSGLTYITRIQINETKKKLWKFANNNDLRIIKITQKPRKYCLRNMQAHNIIFQV